MESFLIILLLFCFSYLVYLENDPSPKDSEHFFIQTYGGKGTIKLTRNNNLLQKHDRKTSSKEKTSSKFDYPGSFACIHLD